MADSKRQQIFDAVVARMNLIKTSGGYETNPKVFGWHAPEFEEGDLADGVLNVKDPTEEGEEGLIQPHTHDKKLQFEVEFAVGKATDLTIVPVQARKIVADINMAIAVDRAWGGLARKTSPVSSEIEVEHAGKVVCGGKATFTIEYRHQAFNTYA